MAEGDSFGRRSPEALLEAIESEDRGRRGGQLKIFLGYASGVGKSFRLFDEGRRRHERGEDVVVAAVQAPVGPELTAILRGLDTIPTRTVRNVPVLDMPALLDRHPEVCLVDGLAYDNPPGSRHARRDQDVEELLAAGISVLTSINLGYITEQQAFVREVIGKEPGPSVPQAFLDRADEVVVVDAPAAREEDAEGGNRLAVLRQRALLLTAEVVDRQLEDYLQRHGLRSSWGTQERILVCMTPRANAARMLAAGRRNADRFHGELFAIYVVQEHLTEEDRLATERNAMLARAQGAHLDVLQGRDPVATIMEYARSHRITQVFLGHTLARRAWWRAFGRRPPLDRLIRAAEGMDVRVFPQ
jgi:two-component system, OmpR family, sensor histidine kinase KdpD